MSTDPADAPVVPPPRTPRAVDDATDDAPPKKSLMRRLGFTGPWLAVLILGTIAFGLATWKLQQWGNQVGGTAAIMFYGRHPVVVDEIGRLDTSVMNQAAIMTHPDYSQFSLSNPVVYDVTGSLGTGKIVAVMGIGTNPYDDATLVLPDGRSFPLENPDEMPLQDLVTRLGAIEMREGHLERGLTRGASRVPIPAVGTDRPLRTIEREMEQMLRQIDDAEQAGTAFDSFRLSEDAGGFEPNRESDPAADSAFEMTPNLGQAATEAIREQADAAAAQTLDRLNADRADKMAAELQRLEAGVEESGVEESEETLE